MPKHGRSLRSRCNYILPAVNTNLGKRRFTYQAIHMTTTNSTEEMLSHSMPATDWPAVYPPIYYNMLSCILVYSSPFHLSLAFGTHNRQEVRPPAWGLYSLSILLFWCWLLNRFHTYIFFVTLLSLLIIHSWPTLQAITRTHSNTLILYILYSLHICITHIPYLSFCILSWGRQDVRRQCGSVAGLVARNRKVRVKSHLGSTLFVKVSYSHLHPAFAAPISNV